MAEAEITHILCDLNAAWKLGTQGTAFQLWKRNAYSGRYFLEKEISSTRRALIRYMEDNAIYPTPAAEEVLNTLPETLSPFMPDVEVDS